MLHTTELKSKQLQANTRIAETRGGTPQGEGKGQISDALELVMAMAVVCMTVFSCAVNGCFVHPFLFSHRQSGFSSTKPISPAHKIAGIRSIFAARMRAGQAAAQAHIALCK